MDISPKQCAIHSLKSWLFTPATKADHFSRAAEVGADALIIDLEDAVAPADKENARFDALQYLKQPAENRLPFATASELAASIVHEISQPIAAMVASGQSCLRWLAMDPPNPDNAKAAVERIVRDGKDARDIIKALRNLFKRSEPEKSSVELPQIVQEVMTFVDDRINREQISVYVRIESELPPMSGDPIQLQQVLLNLVSNAIDAMDSVAGRSKKLAVRARQLDEGFILIEIEDSGIGISDHEKVFETFFTTKENGMGMGLSICKTIITSHGGRIWVSPASETGAVFSFTIPSASRTSQEIGAPTEIDETSTAPKTAI